MSGHPFFLPPILAWAVAEHSAQLLSRRASHAAPPLRTSRRPGQQYLPDNSLPQCRHPLCHGTPGHPLCLGAPASNIFQMASRHGAPASHKPHPVEKSTPVWLAIWRTWAGFANSQHRDSTFATPDNICAHSSLLPRRASCSADANLSAHLHRLPTPPPYLRQLRLPLSRGAGIGCWMRLLPAKGAGVGWQMLLLVVRGTVPANHRARF